MKRTPLFALSLALIAGCASYPAPSDHLASAIAATRAAEESGASQVPRAALQLKLAKEQVAQSRQMIEDGENERADFMTLRAYNDAELALAMARENTARKRAEQASALAQPARAPAP